MLTRRPWQLFVALAVVLALASAALVIAARDDGADVPAAGPAATARRGFQSVADASAAKFYGCVATNGDVDNIRLGSPPENCRHNSDIVVSWDQTVAPVTTTTSPPTVTTRPATTTTRAAATTTRPATTVPPTTTRATTTTTRPPATTVPATVPGGSGVKPLGVSGTWNLALQDEFNGTTLDRNLWNTFGSWECCAGGRSNPGNGEQDYKTDGANFSFANGIFTIQARRETAPNGQSWTSGQLGSKQHFTYAFVEVRTQFPSPRGFLSALWTWGAPGTNAPAQEVDIYENYSDDHSDSYMTNHSSGGGGCGAVQHGFDGSAAFHVYGADIRANGIDWYIDGAKRCSTTGHPTAPWDVVYYMTVNAASRAPVPDAATTHAEMRADYIRVWTR